MDDARLQKYTDFVERNVAEFHSFMLKNMKSASDAIEQHRKRYPTRASFKERQIERATSKTNRLLEADGPTTRRYIAAIGASELKENVIQAGFYFAEIFEEEVGRRGRWLTEDELFKLEDQYRQLLLLIYRRTFRTEQR